jgi:ABC-type antimicrobial peptide transport system permease subunit
MRQELAALDPNVALEAPAPLSQQLALFLYPQQIAAVVIGVFGAVGLLLAIVGVYGVVAYHVGQRTREFGIRLALGATPAGLTTLVLRRGAQLIALGVVVGAGLALLLGTAARSFLYGLDAHDPVTFGGVSVLLAAVALAATFVPARRAASVDPLNSLREE